MEEGEIEQEETKDEEGLAFDDQEEEKIGQQDDYEEMTSQGSSQRSTKVIEFDEEGNFLNMKDDDDSSTHSGRHEGMTLEMTDLKPKKN